MLREQSDKKTSLKKWDLTKLTDVQMFCLANVYNLYIHIFIGIYSATNITVFIVRSSSHHTFEISQVWKHPKLETSWKPRHWGVLQMRLFQNRNYLRLKRLACQVWWYLYVFVMWGNFKFWCILNVSDICLVVLLVKWKSKPTAVFPTIFPCHFAKRAPGLAALPERA